MLRNKRSEETLPKSHLFIKRKPRWGSLNSTPLKKMMAPLGMRMNWGLAFLKTWLQPIRRRSHRGTYCSSLAKIPLALWLRGYPYQMSQVSRRPSRSITSIPPLPDRLPWLIITLTKQKLWSPKTPLENHLASLSSQKMYSLRWRDATQQRPW